MAAKSIEVFLIPGFFGFANLGEFRYFEHVRVALGDALGRRDVQATIHVEKSSQKGILIGKGGAMIKRIGAAARAEIAELVGGSAHLRLRVSVSPGWRGDPAALDELGYDE